MPNRTAKIAVVAVVAASLSSASGWSAPPPQKNGGFHGVTNSGSGGSGGGGSGSGGNSGNAGNTLVHKNFTTHLNTTGTTGSGNNNTVRTFKGTTGIGTTGLGTGGSGTGGSGTGGAGTSFQTQSLKGKNLTTFNQNLTNHTPTFTNPGLVTTPKNKLTTGTNAFSGLNANTGGNTNKVIINKNITNINQHITTNNFQTFQKSKGGPFAGQTLNGNQLLLHTNSGQIHALNAHVYNQTFFGNQAIHLAPVGYQPAYLMHASFYNAPWSGSAWGWGWGLGPGFGFGFGGLGWGLGLGAGWGYAPFYPLGLYGPFGYWGRPLGWGFGGWGLGTLCYNSGYYPYYNPYYVQPVNQTIIYNYANPLPVSTNVAGPNIVADGSDAPPPIPQVENSDFEAARTAFRNGNYDAALAHVDAAIAKTPTDSVFHEFRGLVLFAMQDYKQAAGVVHSLLAVGPGWDWTTMSGLYADPDTYTQQLRALEQFVLANPRAADAHFLLAYHYTTIGHSAEAANQLQQVVKLMPSDRLAGELLKMVQGPPKQDPATPPTADIGADTTPALDADGPQPDPIDKDLLPGGWKAARADGSKFDLKLSDDGKFNWKFAAPKQKGDEFAGTWSVEGPVLILQREGGGALPGTVTFDGNERFNFRMVGAPPEDKGLDFAK